MPHTDDEQLRLESLQALNLFGTEEETRFDRLTYMAAEYFGVPLAGLGLLGEKSIWFKSHFGFTDIEIPRSGSLSETTIDSPLIVVEDMSTTPEYTGPGSLAEKLNLRFYAAHQLRTKEGQIAGFFAISDYTPRTFTDENRMALGVIARFLEEELARESEAERAQQVAKALAPKANVRVPGYEIAGASTSARVVGGDFFDWQKDVNGGITFTVADVMGKGMGAAIIAAGLRGVLRYSAATERVGTTMQRVAGAIYEDLSSTGSFVTLLHASLDVRDNVVHYIDAGHGLAMIVPEDGGVVRVPTGGPPLGLFPEDTWERQSVPLGPGDTFLVFSDGVLELFDGSLASLYEVARVVSDAGSPEKAVQALAGAVDPDDLFDDVTVVALKRL
ncbi:PP2C family protein-serine/threonine phosphatase [Microbacteriaceae bacterium 4G12]